MIKSFFELKVTLLYYLYIIFLILCFTLYFNLFNTIEYRHGFDWYILPIHICHSILNYPFSLSVFFFLFRKKSKVFFYTVIVIQLAQYNTFLILFTGTLWGWSQWGSLQFIDYKSILSLVLFLFFTFFYFLFKFNKIVRYSSDFYFILILYHVPILKYNSIWNSEIHQSKSLMLVEIFIHNSIISIVAINFLFLFVSCILFFFLFSYLLLNK